ncbi:MAG: DUF4755 domain-containing protein [Pseudomonadota bacterium]
MGFLVGFLAVWGVLVSLTIGFATGVTGKLCVLIVAWGPVGLLTWFLIARATGREKLHSAMLGALGVQPGAGFDHSEGGTGIALNPKSRTLALLADGGYQSYDYERVREWASNEQKAGQVVGFGLAGAASATGANIRAAREAAANTGLFVTVKDLGRPQWRVAMKDKAMRARWMELLQQEINEGGAAA